MNLPLVRNKLQQVLCVLRLIARLQRPESAYLAHDGCFLTTSFSVHVLTHTQCVSLIAKSSERGFTNTHCGCTRLPPAQRTPLAREARLWVVLPSSTPLSGTCPSPRSQPQLFSSSPSFPVTLVFPGSPIPAQFSALSSASKLCLCWALFPWRAHLLLIF